MPRRPGATGATGAIGAVAGVVALDADASGLGRAPPGAPLPRPFPMVGVATGGPVAGGAALSDSDFLSIDMSDEPTAFSRKS